MARTRASSGWSWPGGKARTSACMVCACPSSVRLNEWSASSRAAPGQSPAACVCRMASTTWPCADEPSGGAPVQHRHLLGQRPAQLQPEQIPEQVVVAEPGTPGVERHDERVRVREFQQDPLRARAAGQHVGQLAVDPVEQGGAQQQILDVGWLALQHLRDQVLRDRAVAAGELRDEPLGVGVTSQGDRREPQARGPPLRPLVQQRRPGLRTARYPRRPAARGFRAR